MYTIPFTKDVSNSFFFNSENNSLLKLLWMGVEGRKKPITDAGFRKL